MSDSKDLRKKEIKKLIIVISAIVAIIIIAIFLVLSIESTSPSNNEPCQPWAWIINLKILIEFVKYLIRL